MYGTLKTVFEQQYSVSSEKIILPLENEKVSAQSIQSPHDTDCHYRNKDGNKVKRYSVNITETCDQAKEEGVLVLNLITDTEVNVVSTPDNSFLEPALEHTQEILTDSIVKDSNVRNDVEAAIFQLGYHYPNDKSRYRSLAKRKLWAYSRSLWINFVRIVNYCVKPNGQSQACLSYVVASNSLTLVKYITRICQRALFGQKSPQYIAKLYFNMYIIVNILFMNKTNHIFPAKLHFSSF